MAIAGSDVYSSPLNELNIKLIAHKTKTYQTDRGPGRPCQRSIMDLCLQKWQISSQQLFSRKSLIMDVWHSPKWTSVFLLGF